jgi:hypothetical protein
MGAIGLWGSRKLEAIQTQAKKYLAQGAAREVRGSDRV